ncbi:hypothetical protein QC763_403977 [Podospora pseudopauciseta]|uniref:Uncharacterized protein n=2 Tax=Podospora TaxID=5144 RepID=A0ABR0HCN7_9PEZI|nr:hypothetical protein QC763_403977 [Podospora pseudopauciseta]KAK4676823.1 hypothetical protein QC764_403977 [Podospora pseudoanserina]
MSTSPQFSLASAEHIDPSPGDNKAPFKQIHTLAVEDLHDERSPPMIPSSATWSEDVMAELSSSSLKSVLGEGRSKAIPCIPKTTRIVIKARGGQKSSPIDHLEDDLATRQYGPTDSEVDNAARFAR